MDAFVLLLDIVSPHGPPFSKIVESTSDGIDGPWIVAHIGQGGMADDWWQSAPGNIAAPPILSWESGAENAAIFLVYTVHLELNDPGYINSIRYIYGSIM